MRVASSPPGLTPAALRHVPLARAETIPSAWYTDPAYHAFDRAAVLGRHWQYVGPAAQVAVPGQYVAADVAGEPVLVVRDRDGTLRGFYNVCRHRGGPLAMAPCGEAQMLQCKYHGWTYRLDGSLRGVPRFDRVDLFDKRDYGLVPVRVAVWQDLVFACLDPEAPALDTALDGIAARIAPLDLRRLRFAHRDVYDVACNWKVYVDNYLEGYHVPLVHPELCDVLSLAGYVTETFAHYSLQHSPLRDDEGRYRTGADGDAAFYYFIFPNVMLNILPGRLQVNAVHALAPDRCRVVFDYSYAEVDGEAAQRRIAEDVAFSDRVQQEDVEICEHVQRGLASRAYDQGRFSVECEAGVHHFQGLLKGAYRRALSRAGADVPAGTAAEA